MPLFDPLLEAVKLHVKLALRRSGQDPSLADVLTVGLIHFAAAMAPAGSALATNPIPTMPDGAPSGTLLAELLAFLASPAGQQLIQLIISLIVSGGHLVKLMLVGEHGCGCTFDPKTGLYNEKAQERGWIASHPPAIA